MVQNEYEICLQSAAKIGTVNAVVTNFIRILHEVQTICMNLCHSCVCVVCGCAWSQGLLFVWAWVHSVCVRG